MSEAGACPVHAAAPLRLDFAGGWTDVPPYATERGGLVVNAAIGLYAHATVETGGQGILLMARDLSESVRYASPAQLRPVGPLALLQAALRRFPVSPCTITTRSEAPQGSGLGSSGALDVALVAALTRARHEELDREALAHAAWEVEAVEAGMPGGKQDQYAAALGGCRLLQFREGRVETEVIELDPGFRDHLNRHLILCYTGTSRVSGRTIERVMQAYARKDSTVVAALDGIRETAAEMGEALRQADVARVGALLSRNWDFQCALDPDMRTPQMARLEVAMRDQGVLGGKAAGAGAGGCMFFLAADSPSQAMAAARQAGAQLLPVSLVPEGVRSW